MHRKFQPCHLQWNQHFHKQPFWDIDFDGCGGNHAHIYKVIACTTTLNAFVNNSASHHQYGNGDGGGICALKYAFVDMNWNARHLNFHTQLMQLLLVVGSLQIPMHTTENINGNMAFESN